MKLVNVLQRIETKACPAGGLVKSVRVIADAGPADITVSISRNEADADFKLFVHSVRFSHHDAAALFDAMRHYENANRPSAGADDDSGQESW